MNILKIEKGWPVVTLPIPSKPRILRLMQYFIAVPIPEDTKEQIVSFQRSFASNKVPDIVEPHITVKAQSGLTEDLAWLQGIESAVKSQQTFSITLSSVGSFADAVVFLNPSSQAEFMTLHLALMQAVQPSAEQGVGYFENENYHAHLTLAGTNWGMTSDELVALKARAQEVFVKPITFTATFVRVYQKSASEELWQKMTDIELKPKD